MIHHRLVKCVNCRLPINPGEELVRVDTKDLTRRRRRGKIWWAWQDEAPIRYRHASYEQCAAAEARAAEW